jgi:Brp/Blh family beta-carotene 15,15'-monooxygenase
MKLRAPDLFVVSLALVLLAATSLMSRTSAEWLALGLIILAGIPHGSFDLRAAERLWGSSAPRRVSVIVAYIVIGVSMSALCLLWPSVGLSIFLIISAVHFAEGERLSSSSFSATILGVGAILLPISYHLPEARQYLGFFASGEALTAIEPFLRASGVVLSVLVALTIGYDYRVRPDSEVLQKLVCLVAWIILPPLSGFCVWFIGRHSRQHLQRSKHYLSGPILSKGVPIDFIVLSILAIALIAPLSFWFDLNDIHQLFAASIVLIAGLTLPHMIVTHISDRS